MPSKKRSPATPAAAIEAAPKNWGSTHATFSGPSTMSIGQAQADALPTDSSRLLATQLVGAETGAAGMPANPNKAAEHGLEAGRHPPEGAHADPHDPIVGASTVSEGQQGEKVGTGALPGTNPTNDSLDRVRIDSTGQTLTTNMGVPIADNQNSLKAGLRGPTLMEDFVLREKITHFDHERIPERIVHARGSAAHGYFEAYDALTDLTRAAPFAKAGKQTSVFVRFSTVAGERGSADLARDVRGFAVKFYTDEGNWDIVGNNIPVFFIQDAMKFPDLIHAVKPEQNNGIPQAASAHDTFWDFVSLMPESAHMLMWVMSDRSIPRSYRTMQGFGVHTFRLVNAEGASTFCKFHWQPVAGTHSVVWDEAVKINGADPDFHRRDLWEAIEGGAYPEWELGLQVFSEADAEKFSFDVLDATKLIPEEMVPIRLVGKMVLNRNPDNFFAETEQVAFGTGNMIPGIDTSNDPLLQGRHHSYLDTQLSRLGGPNFHEIPINTPLAQVHNNQREGIHRVTIPRGRVAYEPNSLAGGCPFQAGVRGFVPFPAPVFEDKVRGKPEKFADHFTQATLFWSSQTEVEKNHIVGAYRFELTKVRVQAIRERVISMLANVDSVLAERVAQEIGIAVPGPQTRALKTPPAPEVTSSPALSMFARPGVTGIKTKRVALMVCEGADLTGLFALHSQLAAAGALPRFIGARLGKLTDDDGQSVDVEVTFETAPSVLWDAVVVPDGDDGLAALGRAVEFLKDQYRHCKPILLLGAVSAVATEANLPTSLPSGDPDPGLLSGTDPEAAESFRAALAGPRIYERETDPPLI